MNRYWPHQPSINLNIAIADLFLQTHHKFLHNRNYESKNDIAINILDQHSKKQLFLEILTQLETLILDTIELNLEIEQIREFESQILYNCMHKSMEVFIKKFKLVNQKHLINFNCCYNKLFFYEHSMTMQNLLTYLIFGSSKIENKIFAFCKTKTPFNHVKGLLENTIIQTSNWITFNILENYKSPRTSLEIINNQVYNFKYQSTRDLLNFRNNLIANTWFNFYIRHPQNIYCGKYKVLLLSSKGVIDKSIYMNRAIDYLKLSDIQLGSIIWLEIQDFIIPKASSLIGLIGQLIVYILETLINKSIYKYFNQKPKKDK